MFKSIRAKFITTYSVSIVAFIIVLLSVFYINERERVLNIALEKSIEISKLHATLVSSELRQYITALQAVSRQPKVIDGELPHIMHELSNLLILGDGRFNNATYVDRHFQLTDVKGRTSSLAGTPFVDDQRWFEEEFHLTPPIISSVNGDAIIALGVPVKNSEGEWTGALTVAITLDYLAERLDSISLGKGSYSWLSGPGGIVISHPKKELVMKVKIFEGDDIGFPGFSAIANETMGREEGYGSYYDDNIGEHKIVTFARVPDLPEWIMFVTTRSEEIFKEVNQVFASVLFTSFVLLAVFIVIMSKISSNMTRPIRGLTAAVRASVNNRFKTFEVSRSEDEIGLLSSAFHDAISQINHHTYHLEEMVEKRTRELNDSNSELEAANALLNEKNRELENIASKDPLTQLYNRRAFNVFAEKEMSRAARHGTPVSVVLLDIDHFKKVNDRYGHDVGDNVLCRLAHILTTYTRRENVIGRWGGEEFIMLIAESDEASAVNAVTALRERIESEDFGPIQTLTVSAGVANYRVGEPLKEWVNRADKALYQAKAAGRNCVMAAGAETESSE